MNRPGVFCSLFLLSSPFLASAAPIFLHVSEGIYTPYGGHGWIRTFPDEVGWFILHGVAGDYYVSHLNDNFEVDWEDGDQIHLTGHNDLKDHAIMACPEGGYLHVSFANNGSYDTLYSFRYDDAWSLLEENIVVTGDPQVHSADAPVLCSRVFNATGYGYGQQSMYRMFLMDDEGAPLSWLDLEDPVSSAGSSMIATPDGESVIVVGFPWQQTQMQMRRYDPDVELIQSKSLELPVPSDRRAFWPQGLMRVGHTYLVAYVVTTEVNGKSGDTGDIWLSAYDEDWELIDTTVVIAETEEYWAYMRPGLSRKGDQVLVSFDVIERPFLAVVTIDLEAAGEETSFEPGDDDASAPSETPSATPCVASPCGQEENMFCSSGGKGVKDSGLLWLTALFLHRRVRRSRRSAKVSSSQPRAGEGLNA